MLVLCLQRLGCGKAGAADIKHHPWFAGLDWDKVPFFVWISSALCNVCVLLASFVLTLAETLDFFLGSKPTVTRAV